MLTCLPTDDSSWNYEIFEADRAVASVEPFTFSEKAVIRYRGESFDVVKPVYLGGEWNLSQSSGIIALAKKPNPLFRSFDLTSDRLYFTLKASNPLGRAFEITTDSRMVGTISPIHLFTRRAVIDCAPAMPVLLQLFSFCLVVFTWKRRTFDLDFGDG